MSDTLTPPVDVPQPTPTQAIPPAAPDAPDAPDSLDALLAQFEQLQADAKMKRDAAKKATDEAAAAHDACASVMTKLVAAIEAEADLVALRPESRVVSLESIPPCRP